MIKNVDYVASQGCNIIFVTITFAELKIKKGILHFEMLAEDQKDIYTVNIIQCFDCVKEIMSVMGCLKASDLIGKNARLGVDNKFLGCTTKFIGHPILDKWCEV